MGGGSGESPNGGLENVNDKNRGKIGFDLQMGN